MDNEPQVLQALIEGATAYETPYRTAYHFARQARKAKPGATYTDLATPFGSFCSRHELDHKAHDIELAMIFLDGVDLTAHFIEVQERLEADPFRVELPHCLPSTWFTELCTLATAAKYLEEFTGGSWHMSCRKAAELTGMSHTHAAKCLRLLEGAGVIAKVAEARIEYVLDVETGERKRVSLASEYRYLGEASTDAEKPTFTHITQDTQYTHHHQEGNTLETPSVHPKPVATSHDAVGGGVDSLFEEGPKAAHGIGDTEAIIAMAMKGIRRPSQPAVIPMQETIETPTTARPGFEIREVPCCKCGETEPQEIRATDADHARVCSKCAIASKKPTAGPVARMREEGKQINRECKAAATSDEHRSREFANLFARYLGEGNSALAANRIAKLVDQYGIRCVGEMVGEIIQDKAFKTKTMNSPVGVLSYRLGEAAKLAV